MVAITTSSAPAHAAIDATSVNARRSAASAYLNRPLVLGLC